MTNSTYSLHLKDVLPLPSQFDGVVSSLDNILSEIGLTNLSLVVNPPTFPPGSTQDEPPISLEEAMALLDYFDGELDETPTPSTITPSIIPTTPLDMGNRVLTLGLKVLSDIVVELPGLDGISLVLNPGGFQTALTLDPEHFSIGFTVSLGIRFSPTMLPPLRKITNDDGSVSFEPDQSRPYVQVQVANVSVTIDATGIVNVSGGLGVRLSDPVMIGETGVVIESADLVLNVVGDGSRPAGTPAGWKGILINNASLRIPDLFSGPITATGLGIGSGGVSGTIGGGPFLLNYNPTSDPPFTGDMVGDVFGIHGGLREFSLTFQQNIPTGGSIHAQCVLPFFEADEPLDLDISLTNNGTFTVALHSDNGLLNLTRPSLFNLTVDSIAFVVAQGVFITKLSGQLAPQFAGLNWPSFQVKELSIDSKGHVHIQGGWLNLPTQYHLNFYGFQIEITKLGFGNTPDGGKWIGFSGGIKLVDNMPASASVEGLRLTWYDDGSKPTQISLNGVEVELTVPDVLSFKGMVSYQSATQKFQGSVTLNLIALNMEVDGSAVFGTGPGYTYLALYLAAQLPAGIPLWATGLGLYGMQGLMALDMMPNKTASQPWYAINSTTDWYHSAPAVGVTNLQKWTNQPGSTAFGAGVTIGTLSDNGHAFSGNVLLVILLPGPTILIQGSASMLQSRATLDKDANFRALGVLDSRAGTFLMGLDAHYQYDSGGRLIDIRGGAEAFFSLSDPHAWHLYLGEKDPPAKRIRAQLFHLFTANAYVMLDAHQLALGAWIGYNQSWQFGPLSVTVDAWVDGSALVSWNPAHFHGSLWLHGSAQLSAFGFSVGLTVDARLDADVFDPFHILGQFSVGIHLPWPLSDINVSITLEWGPQPTPPAIPLPLKEIAVEHFKATTSWPLPRGTLLLPDPQQPSPTQPIPVVPLDSRPHVTFSRPVNDDALVGVNAQPVVPEWELIGDPTKSDSPVKVRYSLQRVALEKQIGGSWPVVAQTPPATPGGPKLYGSWAPVPHMPDGGGQNISQTKLWLWSKTAFDYTLHTGGTWSQWFTDRFSGYPCGPLVQDCWNFEQITPTQQLPNPWQYPNQPNIVFSSSGRMALAVLNQAVEGLTHALCFSPWSGITIQLPETVNVAKVLTQYSPLLAFSGYDAQGNKYGPFTASSRDDPTIEIRGGNMVRLATEPGLTTLASNLGGAIGCAYIPTRNQFVFVDFNGGNISSIDLATNHSTVLGTGYTYPEDIVVTADGTTAYVTERGGDLVRVNLTSGNASRANAIVISQGLTAPQQIAFDEAGHHAYVVEYATSGRLLRIDVSGETIGQQTVLATGLNYAVGLLMAPDWSAAYVGEQGSGSRVSRITFSTNTHDVLLTGLTSPFFMRWADTSHTHILLALRDPANSIASLDLTRSPVTATTVLSGVPFRPSSVAVLSDNQLVVCSDSVVTSYNLQACLLNLCLVKADVLIQHFEDELAHWTEAGQVLEPNTTYRLRAITKYQARGQGQLSWYSNDSTLTDLAYFHTGGPPGVTPFSTPIGYPAGAAAFQSGLDDLTRYVSQAAAVPSSGGYDIGIEFNENYVDLLYKLAWHDLGIHLHDNNGPVRDAQGRVLVLTNSWGVADQLTLTEGEESWLYILTQSGCAFVDPATILHTTTLSTSTPTPLAPQTLYEARLVPLLLHDDFSKYQSGGLGRWSVQGAGQWTVGQQGTPPSYYIIQTASAETTLLWGDDPALPAADPNQPGNWTDYRLNVFLRSSSNNPFGLVFRYHDTNQYYRFTIEPQNNYWKVIKVTNGSVAAQWQVNFSNLGFTYQQNQDYLISVEVIGPTLQISQGTPQSSLLLFSVTDTSPITNGRIGLYSASNNSARFTDVRVDDFRATAPVAYRFTFTSP